MPRLPLYDHMTCAEALCYLDSSVNYEKKDGYEYRKAFGLGRIAKLCALLGDPQRSVRAVHIAGSKGKGSTAAITASILRAAGLRTGLYTSPHLVSFAERIRIDDELIPERDLGRLCGDVKAAADTMADDPPTYFELVTAIAYLYFRERRADIAVYEVGLGGRLDATNILAPLVSAITPVSYEHTDKLGDTLARIAFEKAGIVKEGGVCVIAPQAPEAAHEIMKICHERHARPVSVGHDITYRELGADDARERFAVTGMRGTYPDLEMRLLGSHQVVNAATAIGIVETLAASGIAVSPGAIRDGIASARWDGRLQVAGRRPYIVLDGAQNRASAAALVAAIRRIFRYRRLILVLGVSRDKDVNGIADELSPAADIVILTKSSMAERALEPARIREAFAAPKDTVVTSLVSEALGKARSLASAEDLILVTGSLFVVGDALACRSR